MSTASGARCTGLTPRCFEPLDFRDVLALGIGLTDMSNFDSRMDHQAAEYEFNPTDSRRTCADIARAPSPSRARKPQGRGPASARHAASRMVARPNGSPTSPRTSSSLSHRRRTFLWEYRAALLDALAALAVCLETAASCACCTNQGQRRVGIEGLDSSKRAANGLAALLSGCVREVPHASRIYWPCVTSSARARSSRRPTCSSGVP
jgi:hypothetical protein